MQVEWLEVAGNRDVWRSLGLVVDDAGLVPLMGTCIRIVEPPDDGVTGIVGWALSGVTLGLDAVSGTDADSGTNPKTDAVTATDTHTGADSPTDTDSTSPDGLAIDGLAIDGLAIDGLLADATSIDGLATSLVEPMGPVFAQHELGVSGLDHVVVMTRDLERTTDAVTAVTGCELKRIREVGPMRQGFHRIGRGGLIVEVVERPEIDPGPATFWGVVLNVDDLDAACERIGEDRISAPKDAVQPGRRIATIDRDVGLGLPVALMTT